MVVLQGAVAAADRAFRVVSVVDDPVARRVLTVVPNVVIVALAGVAVPRVGAGAVLAAGVVVLAWWLGAVGATPFAMALAGAAAT